MKIWRKTGADEILKKAGKRGIILSGVSAGAICWCKYGLSDSRSFNNANAGFIRVSALGFVKVLFCPHYDFEPKRQPALKKIMQKNSGVALALENCCALEIIDSEYRIISSKKNANAYKVYWKKNKFYKEAIKQEKEFKPLSEILVK
jgi:dipeptidase E